ncbi:MAG: tRNA uridine-5-carboxymethylaminomethyl(34) synthesis enzyme MnmG [Candidatus Aminicenantes bacterium]|nr:tRNA uridine-5-carboxymethylaminomethyl(34) synthesis enzyme MnmG [Candidatus Aminicenantes bacterium]
MAIIGEYDIIVVGAGHAGCEAAWAASQMGFETLLLTIHLETIAQMSCNPAVGGLAKGHLVREIDALGGLMGRLTDETGIQFRLLNRSRGPAVQAPRAQCDKAKYRLTMKHWLEGVPRLTLFQAIVIDLLVANGQVRGVRTLDGSEFISRAVILTPGTFLNGLIHIGLQSYPAGRANEPPSIELSQCLRRLGLKIIRLKTGTPMRLDRQSIDWSYFTPQPGDDEPVPFSFWTQKKLENKILCYLGYTNEKTHEIIRRNLDKSPLYSGKIKGIGPRYCPSIEDKVVKFPHHNRHQFFLEPEGLDTTEIYVNGLSSSLPLEVQREILKSIPGLDQAKILRPAYGIEYDAVLPTQLKPNLELIEIENLFLAGQINGTSGYEEAAAQGLIAGINAALKLKGKPPFILRRDQAYIGVLIDDLITRGVEEPYRLFTSRAEYRLNLRIDNADERLTPYGYQFGLIKEEQFQKYLKKREKLKKIMIFLEREKISFSAGGSFTLKNYLKMPQVSLSDVIKYAPILEELTAEEKRFIEAEIKYEGYLKKQQREIEELNQVNEIKIPEDFNFQEVPGLTREAVEKLGKFKPRTLGEAKKIPGITPATIINLYVYFKKIKQAKTKKPSEPKVSRET